jgi:hypothetical protein
MYKMKYIDRFTSANQIKQCAKYYIDLLGLQDWRIIFKLTNDLDNDDWAGQNTHDYTSKAAEIRIRKDMPKDLWIKQPHEEVLIHELLHCKFIDVANSTVEGVMFSQTQHTLLDDMARAIFKARYKLTNKNYYFNNEQ